MTGYNFCDLFSGIGGFRLAAQWAGYEFDNEVHSDIDTYANKVYAKHFPNSVQLGDITKINWHEVKEKYKGEWIVTGGFPCQDISIAGKGAGLAGSRSGLWFEMQKAISILRPRFVIAENVGALTFRGLDAVLLSLAEIGYDVEWQDIRASDVGAPHRRERIWITAYPKSANANHHTRTDAGEEGILRWRQAIDVLTRFPERGVGVTANADEESWCGAICEGNGSQAKQGRGPGFWGQDWIEFGVESRTTAILQRWIDMVGESPLVRVDDGIPNVLDRPGACGNSIVPQVALILFMLIKPHLHDTD